ncbi:uncharacterized protein LOC135392440 [Ornithodoros turicata]|uniref:uncharacterized protein LOC135392440 n=1 Tax=Ornithodoros turicata TaxID=34597 RepID=UPI00313865E3
MTRVSFGARSSPFLLAATIRHRLRKCEQDYLQTATLLPSSFYVDDLVVRVETSGAAATLYRETLGIFDSAGMKVNKCVTKEETLLVNMLNGNSTTETVQNQTNNLLGLVWDLLRCCLASVIRFVGKATIMKTSILQSVSRVCDPLDMLGPFTITGKLLLQQIWQAEVDWDDPLPTEIEAVWNELCAGRAHLQGIFLPLHLGNSDTGVRSEIHIFPDASPSVRGAVAYAELTCEGSPRIEFLVSKSRVATIKHQTLARL